MTHESPRYVFLQTDTQNAVNLQVTTREEMIQLLEMALRELTDSPYAYTLIEFDDSGMLVNSSDDLKALHQVNRAGKRQPSLAEVIGKLEKHDAVSRS